MYLTHYFRQQGYRPWLAALTLVAGAKAACYPTSRARSGAGSVRRNLTSQCTRKKHLHGDSFSGRCAANRTVQISCVQEWRMWRLMAWLTQYLLRTTSMNAVKSAPSRQMQACTLRLAHASLEACPSLAICRHPNQHSISTRYGRRDVHSKQQQGGGPAAAAACCCRSNLRTRKSPRCAMITHVASLIQCKVDGHALRACRAETRHAAQSCAIPLLRACPYD
jgi:hypothetical protein